jgi:hypothetical protein
MEWGQKVLSIGKPDQSRVSEIVPRIEGEWARVSGWLGLLTTGDMQDEQAGGVVCGSDAGGCGDIAGLGE